MVIVSRIEYRTQLTFLSKHECDTIMKPFRKLFKQKLHLSISIPNAILENRLIYNFRDFYEVQLQSKITNFLIQVNNTRLLGDITDLRIKQLQTSEWLQYSPLHSWPYTNIPKRFYKKFIACMISLCHDNKITFIVNPNKLNEIMGGTITIQSIINESFKDPLIRVQLRNRSIMFLD